MENIYAWLLPIIPPLLVCTASTRANAGWLIMRLFLAAGSFYVLANLAMRERFALDRATYQTCVDQYEWGQGHEHCDHLMTIGDGFALITHLFVWWIPALIYTGLFEAIWRQWNKQTALSRAYRWCSGFFISWFLGFTLVSILKPSLPLYILGYYQFYHTPWVEWAGG